MVDSFPRQQARTRRFSLGAPRNLAVSADCTTVLFLRSAGGSDPLTSLWALDVASGQERQVVDVAAFGHRGEDTAEARAQRERRREQAEGIVGYSLDASASTVAFSLGPELWVADVASGAARRLEVTGPVFDPRLDPTGTRVAWCCERTLRVVELDGSDERMVAGEDDPDVTWGQAEFVAAEEMHRFSGYWWAPDGASLLVERADVRAVATWWVADPAHPDQPPVAHRYPAAGTADAAVSLWSVALDGGRTRIDWDDDELPYLAVVRWLAAGPPLLVVERRDHRACIVLSVDVTTGATSAIGSLEDVAWVDWPSGLPALLGDGRLVWTADLDDTTRLVVDGEAVTPVGLQVRTVAGVDGEAIVFTASQDPTVIELWRWTPAGLDRLAGDGVVAAAATGGGTVAMSARRLSAPGAITSVVAGAGPARVIASRAEVPVVDGEVRMLSVGPRRLRVGVVLPAGHRPGTRLPVLMYPYGGPGAQMVLADRRVWVEAQWRADQGFAVVVADGRGSPGRGRAWERAIHHDFATAVLEDQVAALRGAAAAIPELDLDRVGICGWSFGGYLSALAVLRRPDVFHAAVAGAPVTDWRLYDTYYTERYLGHPDDHPGVYDRSSLLDDAVALHRPLLLIHGLVDDNVVVAHTLRLSQRLLEAGCSHTVLPLTGITHMASQEDVAENLLVLQTRFLTDALQAAAPLR